MGNAGKFHSAIYHKLLRAVVSSEPSSFGFPLYVFFDLVLLLVLLATSIRIIPFPVLRVP